jgi:ABC-type transport system substrate-binding protein
MKKLVFYFTILALFISCQPKKVSENISPIHGGILHINEVTKLDVVNPNFTNNITALHVFSQVFEGLVKYNAKNLEIMPSVAKSWQANDEKTRYTFNLRTNIFYHNDICFNTETDNIQTRKLVSSDVKQSLEKYCQYHPQNKNNLAFVNLIVGGLEYYQGEESGDVKSVEGIEIENDSVISINLVSPSPFFLHLLADPSIVIFPKEGIDKYGDENKIGTGPFKLTNFQTNTTELNLVRNPNYYLKDKKGYALPYLDSIKISFIGSTQKELSLFKNGELDVVLNLPQKFVNRFLTENVQLFESNPPKFVLHQARDNQDVEIFNLLQAKVHGFYTNSMNYLDFTRVYFEEPRLMQQ